MEIQKYDMTLLFLGNVAMSYPKQQNEGDSSSPIRKQELVMTYLPR